MPKNVVSQKVWNVFMYYTSTHLVKNELFLAASTARSLLQNYEYVKELGNSPKYYDEETIKSIIDDYQNDEKKWTAVLQRKKKVEELRAAREQELYDIAKPVDVVDWLVCNNRIEKDLIPTMLRNLFAALGKEFDMELFYNDVEKVERYKRTVSDFGVPRPLDIVEAEERLTGNNGYLK